MYAGSPWIKEQKQQKRSIAGLERTLELARETDDFDGMEDIIRNLGIAYGRLKCPHPNKFPEVWSVCVWGRK